MSLCRADEPAHLLHSHTLVFADTEALIMYHSLTHQCRSPQCEGLLLHVHVLHGTRAPAPSCQIMRAAFKLVTSNIYKFDLKWPTECKYHTQTWFQDSTAAGFTALAATFSLERRARLITRCQFHLSVR